MRKIKFGMLIMVALFLGMSQINAQERSVMIKGAFSGIAVEITTISPDYEVITQEFKKDKMPEENDFLVLLKKEIDKWLKEGYVLSETGVPSYTSSVYTMLFVLTKKE